MTAWNASKTEYAYDARRINTAYEYDSASNIAAVTYANGATLELAYDKAGNTTKNSHNNEREPEEEREDADGQAGN